MNDCQNIQMREALPELLHGRLAERERDSVQSHVDDCADCAAELAIIRDVLRTAAAPRIDVARISAAIPAYRPARSTRPMQRTYLQLARGARDRRGWDLDRGDRARQICRDAVDTIDGGNVGCCSRVRSKQRRDSRS